MEARLRLKPEPGLEKEVLSLPALVWFVGAHVITIVFAIPFASWQAVVLLMTLHLFFGTAITLGAHRYFSHATFTAPAWLENLLAILYTLSFDRCGEGVISWAAGHRFHHVYPDQALDPHSPLRGFFHAYCGHYIFRRQDLYDFEHYKSYAPALARKPFLVWIDRPRNIAVIQVTWAVFLAFIGGAIFGKTAGFDWWNAAAFLIWGVFVRYCYTQFSHSMVDTISHGVGLFRYLPDTCKTGTKAKNNLLYWTATLGNETWHNIHHAFPRAANNGTAWYRWDLDSFLMKSMQRLNIITGLKFISEEDIKSRMNSKEIVYR